MDLEEITKERRMLPMLKEAWERHLLRHFEWVFILALLVLIPVIAWFSRDRLAFLDLYFLPVLLAGYFLNVRGAVLGSVLSILTVSFFMTLWPEAFHAQPSRLGLYLHLVAWGGFLILTGAVVGRLNEAVQCNFSQLRVKLDDWKNSHDELNRRVDEINKTNADLDAMRKKLETALYSTVDPWVANMMVNKRLVNEKRDLTVLFADIANFTVTVEEMKPEAVVHHMNRLFHELEPIIAAYNGHLDKFIGDGLMAEFGIPMHHQQNALQAVLTGLQIQKRVSSPDFGWKIRIGIAHGEAVVGLVGSEHRKAYTAFGDVVNVAARLQRICPEGSVCVDGATYDKVSRYFDIRRLVDKDKADQSEALDARLKEVQARLGRSPADPDAFIEAASLSGQLGEVPQAIEYYRRALSLNPAIAERIEARVAELVLSKQDRPEKMRLKGRAKPVYSYEVLGLKDPLADSRRIPASVRAYGEERLAKYGLNRDIVLPVEALDGTVGHGVVTAALAGSLAESLGLDETRQRHVFEGGFYHDIGRRNVPEHLLNEEETITSLPEQDQRMISVHIEAAELVLSSLGIQLSTEAMLAIESHHERYDGAGYPKKLAGDAIPLGGRLIRVAAEYDRLTSPRQYRDGWEPAATLTEIKASSERGILDPRIVGALSAIIRNGLAI
ncbi:MAG: HD domain-containing protein [Elusimicrobia bacterium]|nr:HD domain-containing protein [Elusimicrobiota bacterium]